MNFRFKNFFSYYKPYLGLFFRVMICAIIVAIISLVFPLLTRYITKTVLEGNLQNALTEIYKVGTIMLALIVMQTACN